MRLYEAMVLVDSNRGKEDFDGVRKEITDTLERFGCEVVNCDKWDERKLAYPINRQRRALYLLSHFNAPPDAIAKIERAFQISDTVMRAMITLDDDGTDIVPPGRDESRSRDRGDRDRGDRDRPSRSHERQESAE